MRVFWLNGGLHAEPENEVETEALLVLLAHLRYERPPELSGPSFSGSGSLRSDESGGGPEGLRIGH